MKPKEKKYIAVKNYILKCIEEGIYKPEEKIPTEDEIMKTLGFSRSPVRHGVMQLEQENYIYKIHGSGSFVKQTATNNPVNIYALLYPNAKGIEKDFIFGMRQAVNDSSIKDLHLIFKKPGKNTSELIKILQSLDTSKKGGIIVVPLTELKRSVNRLLAANFRKLDKGNFHVVQLDRFVPEYEGSCVMSDHYSGAYLMVQYLINKGHKKIAVVYEHPENSSIKQRLQGVKACLHDNRLHLPETYQFQYVIDEISSHCTAIVNKLLKKNVTAVFCFESEIALEIYKVFNEKKITVPHDISLCSFDDHSFTGIYEGFITAVVQPLEDLGYFSVDLILRELEKPSHKPLKMILEPAIVERQSVAQI